EGDRRQEEQQENPVVGLAGSSVGAAALARKHRDGAEDHCCSSAGDVDRECDAVRAHRSYRAWEGTILRIIPSETDDGGRSDRGRAGSMPALLLALPNTANCERAQANATSLFRSSSRLPTCNGTT